MKQYVCAALCLICLAACGNSASKTTGEEAAPVAIDDGHYASNALDYTGIYAGTIPAADCPGIEVTLVLNDDSTFSCDYDYLERDASFESKGRYWVEKNLLTTVGERSDTMYYKVEENRLRQLDSQKQPIPGKVGEKYVLLKQSVR